MEAEELTVVVEFGLGSLQNLPKLLLLLLLVVVAVVVVIKVVEFSLELVVSVLGIGAACVVEQNTVLRPEASPAIVVMELDDVPVI